MNQLCSVSIYQRRYLNKFPNIKNYVRDVIYVNEPNPNLRALLNNKNIIFTKIDWIGYFINTILPLLKTPFLFVTHNGDQFGGMHEKILRHPLLIKWYGQNMNVLCDKTEGIPIGLENQMWKRTNFETIEKNTGSAKQKLLYLNFSLHTNKDRNQIMDIFLEQGFAQNKTLPWNEYIQDLADYKFCISPKGNGADCHRTWECLYLGVIPIVEKSTPMSFYDELPILFVDDYTIITEDYLNEKYEEYKYKKFNLEKLSIEHWRNKFNNA